MKKFICLLVLVFGVNYVGAWMLSIIKLLLDNRYLEVYFSLSTFIIVATFILWHKIDKVEKLLRQRGEGRDEIKIPEDTAKESEESK